MPFYIFLNVILNLVFSDFRRANMTKKHANKSINPEQQKGEKSRDP